MKSQYLGYRKRQVELSLQMMFNVNIKYFLISLCVYHFKKHGKTLQKFQGAILLRKNTLELSAESLQKFNGNRRNGN